MGFTMEYNKKGKNAKGSGADRFWIEVKTKGDVVVAVMSMERPASTYKVMLEDGDIFVPH